jgi:hypothetical protein
MQVPYQFLYGVAPEGRSTAGPNVTDQQVGRLFATVSRAGRDLVRRARAWKRPPHPAWHRSPGFRKEDPASSREQVPASRSCFRTEFETVAKPSLNHRRRY